MKRPRSVCPVIYSYMSRLSSKKCFLAAPRTCLITMIPLIQNCLKKKPDLLNLWFPRITNVKTNDFAGLVRPGQGVPTCFKEWVLDFMIDINEVWWYPKHCSRRKHHRDHYGIMHFFLTFWKLYRHVRIKEAGWRCGEKVTNKDLCLFRVWKFIRGPKSLWCVNMGFKCNWQTTEIH